MAHATVGVIGHVNHGKTSLVQALTGIQTDRLAEERRRGMSIVLGFAWLALDGGTLDLVDAPGHEQFVRAMVAGATGIHATLLVVDAREGVKPQTVEHVAIADLLGVRRGIVAITKADLVDEARRAAVQRELRARLRDSHLAFAPRLFVSSRTGEGVPALRAALQELVRQAAVPAPAGVPFCLPVDRVFTLAGQGTVVTGTLRGGPLRVGDALEVQPAGLATAVRQLQVHGVAVDAALPGQRVGVNLRHVKPEQLARGDVLAPPGRLAPASLLDAELRLLPGVTAQQLEGRELQLLVGTNEVSVVPRLFGERGGGVQLGQLRSARPVATLAGEPFVLRRASPAATLAGGRILDPLARRHRRSDAAALHALRVLASGTDGQRLAERLRRAGAAGLALDELGIASPLACPQVAALVCRVAESNGARLWHLPLVQELQQRMVAAVRHYHRQQPLRPAAPLPVCRAALPADAPEALYRRLLALLQERGELLLSHGEVRCPEHDPLQHLDARSREALDALAASFRRGGMTPPDPPPPGTPPRRLLDLLVAQGEVLLVPGQLPTQRIAFHRDALAAARDTLAATFPAPNAFTVAQARELLGTTRKFAVPLLEHLHATGHTRRRGDQHMFVA